MTCAPGRVADHGRTGQAREVGGGIGGAVVDDHAAHRKARYRVGRPVDHRGDRRGLVAGGQHQRDATGCGSGSCIHMSLG
jgi:hypothetical protein